jgi:signal peptidase
VLGVLAAVLLLGVPAVGIAVGGVPLLTRGQTLSVHGDSMAPAFERGDVIVVKGVHNLDSIKAGQIVSYRAGGPGSAIPTRRVVGEESKGSTRALITHGDAEPSRKQEVVALDQVIGVYMYRLPKLGYAVTWIGTHGVVVIVISSALAVALATATLVAVRLRAARPGSAGTVRLRVGEGAPPSPANPTPGAAPPLRRRSEVKRGGLVAPVPGPGGAKPKPVPWRPGPAAGGRSPRIKADVPTWDDLDSAEAKPPPAVERLVSTHHPPTLDEDRPWLNTFDARRAD